MEKGGGRGPPRRRRWPSVAEVAVAKLADARDDLVALVDG
eukprot:CAMPEP_0177617832 /NCGR_PEP_ID=MMETSP0419_2-20121207/25168_1 /TAXON_ID=582737 /ORGANISM="Tetraselmis sp., Strain GSL018" /LENGTH=39 /DNA_ID= /DNA_START= /DNA_END= /DNA_ORIENTATION=